ncbi:MAG: hypothetical protein ACYDHH_06225 [Solirubrobacteraceae bacterium]
MPRPWKYPQELIDRGVRLAIESGRRLMSFDRVEQPEGAVRSS